MAEHTKKIALGATVAMILAIGMASGALVLAPYQRDLSNTGLNHSNSQSYGATQQSSSSLASNSSQGISGHGNSLAIYLTDAPPQSQQFSYLMVNVSSVTLRYEANVSASSPSNQFVYNVPYSRGTNVNLTSLVGKSVLLGASNVPAGNITEIILNLTGARAFFADSTSAQLKVVANGKLMIAIMFAVRANGSTDLTIDITPNSMHISNGDVDVLTPVIHVTAVQNEESATTTVTTSASLTNSTSSTSSISSTSTASTSSATSSSVTSTTSSNTLSTTGT